MLTLLVLHAAAAIAAPALVRAAGRTAMAWLALVPAASFAWVAWRAPWSAQDPVPVESYDWAEGLGLDVVLRLDTLSALLALLVTGVGALVLTYASRYFAGEERRNAAFTGTFLAFAGSMLALVVSDHLVVLYVAWELTTVFSYLLIGYDAHVRVSRRAAMQALVLTTAGGLAMLVGFLALGHVADTYLLSELLADPPRGTLTTVAVGLVLLGALTKSAILPFHFWLPAAMAAPTPVSAYLHAAAMVKAGVFLVARLAPGFADLPLWQLVVVPLGLGTMLLGGWTALRQSDLKLLLAHGTVSQLGFLLVLLGFGTRPAALAGATLLLAHALFKSTLFLVVGVVDHAAHTRDLRRLSGLRRSLPWSALAAVLAGASMAGVPPLVGFVGKEAAYEAFLHVEADVWWPPGLVLAGVVAGSMLTVAYTGRFLWGAFADKPDVPPTHVERPSAVTQAVPLLLGGAGLAVVAVLGPLDTFLAGYADSLPGAGAEDYHLALWHGLGAALWLSALTVATGVLLHVGQRRVAAVARALPRAGSAPAAFERTLDEVDRFSVWVTARTQRASLPGDLATILLVLVVAAGGALVTSAAWPSSWRAWDDPLQLPVGAAVVAAAAAAAVTRQRVAAVVLVGASGYGVAVLFALQGAPDLVLTQLLVETLTLVVFVLVLRKLPRRSPERHSARQRRMRIVLAVAVGCFVAGAGAVAVDARTAPAVSVDFPEAAYEVGGGENVVNVTLVDIRAWDTLGEVSVLVVAATGVASLVFLRRRTGAPPRRDAGVAPTGPGVARPPLVTPRAGGTWLRGGAEAGPQDRSIVLEVVVRLTFHTIVVLSLYLLVAGHDLPGGGFIGGLVVGLGFTLRYLAAGRYELGEAAPFDPGLLLGLGLLLAGGTGAVGLVLGAEVLETAILETTLPVIGGVKLVTSLFFDVGVYLLVAGLVLDVLRSLGAELDRRVASGGMP